MQLDLYTLHGTSIRKTKLHEPKHDGLYNSSEHIFDTTTTEISTEADARMRAKVFAYTIAIGLYEVDMQN